MLKADGTHCSHSYERSGDIQLATSSSATSNALLALSNNLADAIEQAGHAVVTVNARRRMPSSGVHWQQGVVVTADYTIKREEDITVTLPDGRTVPATLAGRDSGTDLAVLRLQETERPVAEIGDPTSLKVGHLVLAIARPGENGLSASLGVISALSGTWRSWHGGQIDQFIRPDLTLYPGFSGGPLVNVQGQVMGINTSGPRNLVLTIPASTVNRVVDQLLQTGRIARGYLGLGMQPVRLPDNLKQSLNLSSNGGVIVVSLEPNGPADRAGILIGDILVALDQTSISDISDVHAMLDPERVGKPLRTQIIRGGNSVEVSITVGERPQGEA
jgi:S1-C subfamily serine protease